MPRLKPILFAVAFGLLCSAQFSDASNDVPVEIAVGNVSPMLSNVCANKPNPKECAIDVVTALKFAKQVGRTEAYCEVYNQKAIKTEKYDRYCQEFEQNVDVKDLYDWIGTPE